MCTHTHTQLTLFLGQFNAIAPLVTMFFLVSYGVVNLACFALKFASAVNFRCALIKKWKGLTVSNSLFLLLYIRLMITGLILCTEYSVDYNPIQSLTAYNRPIVCSVVLSCTVMSLVHV